MFVPVIKADVQLEETYKVSGEDRAPFPIVAVHGLKPGKDKERTLISESSATLWMDATAALSSSKVVGLEMYDWYVFEEDKGAEAVMKAIDAGFPSAPPLLDAAASATPASTAPASVTPAQSAPPPPASPSELAPPPKLAPSAPAPAGPEPPAGGWVGPPVLVSWFGAGNDKAQSQKMIEPLFEAARKAGLTEQLLLYLPHEYPTCSLWSEYVRKMVSEIDKLHKGRPLLLLGFSSGCAPAYAVAHRLGARVLQVCMVAMRPMFNVSDAAPPHADEAFGVTSPQEVTRYPRWTLDSAGTDVSASANSSSSAAAVAAPPSPPPLLFPLLLLLLCWQRLITLGLLASPGAVCRSLRAPSSQGRLHVGHLAPARARHGTGAEPVARSSSHGNRTIHQAVQAA